MIDPSPEEYEYDPYKDCRPLPRYNVQYCYKGTWAIVSEGFKTKTEAMKSVNFDMLYYRVVNEYGAVV